MGIMVAEPDPEQVDYNGSEYTDEEEEEESMEGRRRQRTRMERGRDRSAKESKERQEKNREATKSKINEAGRRKTTGDKDREEWPADAKRALEGWKRRAEEADKKIKALEEERRRIRARGRSPKKETEDEPRGWKEREGEETRKEEKAAILKKRDPGRGSKLSVFGGEGGTFEKWKEEFLEYME